ncbi:MAG TPA: membrane protein insertion efficiency factor YidD [Chthoniobacterales bacterium]
MTQAPDARPATLLKRRRFWFLIAAVALAAAAIFDWTRPPQTQLSARFYERSVVLPYRAHVRPFVSRFVRCRYQPTCSQYSVEAIQVHGFPRGAWLTVKRLCRCLPWVPLGSKDPVPPK